MRQGAGEKAVRAELVAGGCGGEAVSPGLPECIERCSEHELRARMLGYLCPPTPAGGLLLQAEEVFAEGSQVPGASLVSQLVKNLLATQETLVQSLGLEDSLEKG